MSHFILHDLVDPVAFKNEYPDTVNIINPCYWNNVEVGHYVRIRRECEYFWVHVKEVTDDYITGEVYYELGTNPFEIGDMLEFKKCFMFDIHDPQTFNTIPGIDV